jgi:predicted nucleic acid-binding protein
MSGRFFLDTNIFVYSFDPTAPSKSQRANELILEGIQNARGVISYQVIQEFFNLALRKFQHPLTASEAEQYLATVFGQFAYVPSSARLFFQALRIADKSHLAWYDSLIVAAALESNCTTLYTEDLQHGERFGELRVNNPFF